MPYPSFEGLADIPQMPSTDPCSRHLLLTDSSCCPDPRQYVLGEKDEDGARCVFWRPGHAASEGWNVGIDVSDIADDLAHLQRNRGLQSANLAARVGPALAQVTGYGPARGADARTSLIRQLLVAAQDLPPDLHLAFARACATRPDDQPTLTARLRDVGTHIKRSTEVARRRVTDANLLVASRLMENTKDAKGWFLHELRSHVDLRNDSPVYRASYTLVVTAPTLTHVTEMISLPGDGTDLEPGFAVSGSVRLDAVRRVHPQTWECQMSLDRTYGCGELIQYTSSVRLPDRTVVPPMLVMAPRRDCRLFAATVHLAGLADQVWVLDGVTPPTVTDDEPTGPLIDPAAEPRPTVEFHNLVPGLVYGLRWTWRGRPSP